MTQAEFNEKMKCFCNASNAKLAVEQAMQLAYQHPGLAMAWVESNQDSSNKQERYVDSDSVEGQLVVLRKVYKRYTHHSLENVIQQMEALQKERNKK